MTLEIAKSGGAFNLSLQHLLIGRVELDDHEIGPGTNRQTHDLIAETGF